MGLRFEMATLAFQGCIGEAALRVTGGTSQGSMPAFQRETGGGVVEIGHAVDTIMAGHTIRAVILQVGGHKDRVVAGVAILTALQRQGESTSGEMAGITIHGHRAVIHLVPAQAETGLLVIEMCESWGGNIDIPAKMIGVATAALLDIQQTAVGTLLGGHLVENRGVAAQAQVGLGGLERRVAIGTLGLELLMGVETTQGDPLAALGG